MLRSIVLPFLTGIAIVVLGLALASVTYRTDEEASANPLQTQAEPTGTAADVALSAGPPSASTPSPTSTAPPATVEPRPAAAPQPPTPEPSPTAMPPERPPRPAGLTAVYEPGSGVILTWQAVPGAGYYNVYRSEMQGGWPGAIYDAMGSIGGSQVRDDSALPAKRYYYVVTAVREGLEGPSSNEAAVDTGP